MRSELALTELAMNNLHNADAAKTTAALGKTISLVLGQPFDIARAQYAIGVRAGLFKDSMLASARFSRDINVLETLTLGPWARQV
jgi:hypothetical protein